MSAESPFQTTGGGVLGPHLRTEMFRALCDPTRLRVLGRLALADRPVTVTEVAGCCGVHLSGVSRHLAILREAGLVEAERRGREVHYSLRAEELTGTLRGLADAIDQCRLQCETGECCDPNDEDDEVKK